MPELTVKIPSVDSKNYRISIGTDILKQVWSKIEADFPGCSKFIVTDENVLSAGHVEKLLGGGDVGMFVIKPAGEAAKNINTVVSIIEAMEQASLGRDSVVVGVGGGTVGDIAGFAAAIFKRGVPVIHIPTTTVSQADSSVGGKTGVDSSLSKNAFGVFWQPAAVYIDSATLATMDERQFRAGLAESLKHAFIADEKFFEFIESNIDDILRRDTQVFERMAFFNCSIKASVVEIDPNERNQRRILNYGHTIGHAIEAASDFNMLHGEAIAVGMTGAGLIEIELGLGDQKRVEKVSDILQKLGLSVRIPRSVPGDRVMELLKHDKKAIDKWPRFVLLERIGKVYCPDGQWAVKVTRDVVEKVLDRLYE